MTITTLMLNEIRDRVQDDIDILFTHAAVGDDDTSPTAGDTTLGNETFRSARDAVDKSVDNKITCSLAIGAAEDNGNDIKEFGWFDDPSAGTMWIRNILTTITKTSDIQVWLDTTITITISEDTS